MPEIWLPYGKIEVPVEVKTENLTHVTEVNTFSTPEINWDLVPKVDQETLFIVPEMTVASENMLIALLEHQKTTGGDLRSIKIVSKDSSPSFKKSLTPYGVTLHQLSHDSTDLKVDEMRVRIPNEFLTTGKKIMITQVGFDPLFGFSGGPISLLRYLDNNFMGEALARRVGDNPLSGEDTAPSKFATKIVEQFGEILSIECQPQKDDRLSAHVGEINSIHQAASEDLLEDRTENLDHQPMIIAASTGGHPYDDTLTNALNAIFNVAHGTAEKGSILLFGECGSGLGSKALWMKAIGSLNRTSLLNKKQYVDGMETEIFLESIKDRFSLTLVSTLPRFYVEQLGIIPAMKSSEALKSVLASHRSRSQILVVPNAATTVIRTNSA